MIGRRRFITGLVSLVAAPAIVRAGSLMPVRVVIEPLWSDSEMLLAKEMMERLCDLQMRRSVWAHHWQDAAMFYVDGSSLEVKRIEAQDVYL